MLICQNNGASQRNDETMIIWFFSLFSALQLSEWLREFVCLQIFTGRNGFWLNPLWRYCGPLGLCFAVYFKLYHIYIYLIFMYHAFDPQNSIMTGYCTADNSYFVKTKTARPALIMIQLKFNTVLYIYALHHIYVYIYITDYAVHNAYHFSFKMSIQHYLVHWNHATTTNIFLICILQITNLLIPLAVLTSSY